jgi:hypothetical protein
LKTGDFADPIAPASLRHCSQNPSAARVPLVPHGPDPTDGSNHDRHGR